MKIVPYGKQSIDSSDIKEVVRVLKTDWITQGPKIDELESALAKYCGSKFAVCVSSGTAALHLACVVAGLKKGNEAITTPITFLATANSIVYTGAKPVFADINYDTINIDPVEITKRLTKETKAILPVHFAGLSCDMPEIGKLAKKNKLKVIEDACHSLGSYYSVNGKWYKVGSCKHSDMTVFSFHPVKHITSGEGGAITTNDKKIYEKLKMLRSHGVVKTSQMTKKKGPWYYEMRDLGFNYRITDFQCALALSQLKRIHTFLARRRAIANMYDKAFSNVVGIETPVHGEDRQHAYHLYILKINFDRLGMTKRKFFEKLKNKGIFCQMHYIPIYKQPYYADKMKTVSRKCPNGEKYYNRAVSIPIYPKMTDRDVQRVSREIINTLSEE